MIGNPSLFDRSKRSRPSGLLAKYLFHKEWSAPLDWHRRAVRPAGVSLPAAHLLWHEIVNDEIAGVPVAYCPFCNTSIVFDRRVAARVPDFGTTGKLRTPTW